MYIKNLKSILSENDNSAHCCYFANTYCAKVKLCNDIHLLSDFI